MKSNHRIDHLSIHEKWLFIGHILTALGGLAIAIGNTMRFANEGKLHAQQTFHTVGQHDSFEPIIDNNNARKFYDQ